MLKHTSERYLDTFLSAGFKGQIGKSPWIQVTQESVNKASGFLEKMKIGTGKIKIGLAPFATLSPKIWGIENFKVLVTLINQNHEADFFLFGGGAEEIELLKDFQKFSPNIHLVAGELELPDELSLIKLLDLMISMDSSNMHLAALSGIPTISIWGGTHPAFGFYAIGQPMEYHLQIPASALKCRPCSVFGNQPCIYPSPRCMEMVSPQMVYNNLMKFNLLKTKVNKAIVNQ